jgi:LPLT family lysophospholipid transporter-like MFS transporter
MTQGAFNGKLMVHGMWAVLIAQFLSAFADNALLFTAIALLKQRHAPEWYEPMLQEFFVFAFIILAPFVGPVADAYSKGRVMLWANATKLLGAVAMLTGFNPLLAYGIVGLGAAGYSPAKYGILSEMVGPERLVKANSLLEGSTIVAILLGAVTGGRVADLSVATGLSMVAACYFLAGMANLGIPKLPAAHPVESFKTLALVKDFWSVLKTLFGNRDARFSLLGTSLFWGVGSTLRFLLVAWVPVALAITDNGTPANLNGAVAVGIAIGAGLAARFVTLQTVNRSLWAGLALGGLIIVFAQLKGLPETVVMLMAIGACGGFYVVPLNALLQERGHETVGSGHAIAVQNFGENFAMLALVGCYTLLIKSGASVITVAHAFGIAILLGMTMLALGRLARQRFG